MEPSSTLFLPLAEKTNTPRRSTASPRIGKVDKGVVLFYNSAPPSPTSPGGVLSPGRYASKQALRAQHLVASALSPYSDPQEQPIRAPLSPFQVGSSGITSIPSGLGARLRAADQEAAPLSVGVELASCSTRKSTRERRPTEKAKGESLRSNVILREYRKTQPHKVEQDYRNRLLPPPPHTSRHPVTAMIDAYQSYGADEGIFAFGASPTAMVDPLDERQLDKAAGDPRSSPSIPQQGQGAEERDTAGGQHYSPAPTGLTSGLEEQRNPPFPHAMRYQSDSPAEHLQASYSQQQSYSAHQNHATAHQQQQQSFPSQSAYGRSDWPLRTETHSRQTSFSYGPFPASTGTTRPSAYHHQAPLYQPGTRLAAHGAYHKVNAPRPIKYLVPVFEKDGQYFQHPSYPVEPVFEETRWQSPAYAQPERRFAGVGGQVAPRPVRTVSFANLETLAPSSRSDGGAAQFQVPKQTLKQEELSPPPSLPHHGEADSDMQGDNHDQGYALPPAYPGTANYGHASGLPGAYEAMATSRAPSGMFVEARHSGETTPTDLGEYEKERLANIRQNDQLMQSLGLHGPVAGSEAGSSQYGKPRLAGKRKSSHANLKANPNDRRRKASSRQFSAGPTRASRRIASMAARTSYSNLAGEGSDLSDSEDEYYSSRSREEEDDYEWEGSDESRSQRRKQGRRSSSNKHRTWGGGKTKPRQISYNDPTLRDLVDEHPELRDTYPLFYHSCTSDMLISNDAFPLIGSVPATCGPVEKAEYLKRFFHKGRRCLAQLDAFTARCEKKYDGPGQRWRELDYAMRIAIRDIRRKGVERCENYKYTRRDLLNRALGKNNWEPIEDGWVAWSARSLTNDPAGDLQGVRLLSPPPKPQHPVAPRPDPLMQGLQQPLYPPTNRKSRKRKTSRRTVSNQQMQQGTSAQPEGLQIIHYQPDFSEDEDMQEEGDSADEVDEEEARLEQERQERLAQQQSQQRYTHAQPQPLVIGGQQQPFGMYSAVRGGDEASTIASSVYRQAQQMHTPVPIMRNGGDSYQLGVDMQHGPASSQSTFSHPLSSAQSQHNLGINPGMQMMSGEINMSFPMQAGGGLPDAPMHYQPQQQQGFQVGLGPIYTSTYTPDQAANSGPASDQQGPYAGVQGTQWTGPM